MQINDVIRGVLDIIDAVNDQPEAQVIVAAPVEDAVSMPGTEIQTDDAELVRMKQIAGLMGTGEGEYSNTPDEQIADISAVLATGDDVHKSKHPADIRTNAPSMFPGFQARG